MAGPGRGGAAVLPGRAGAAVLLLLAGGASAVSQYRCESIEFVQHVVSDRADGAAETYANDLDGDGDIDMMSAASKNNEVAWYDENDGDQSFSKHVVDDAADGAYAVGAIDFDGDADVDIVAAASKGDAVYWYENDGAESFARHSVSDDEGQHGQ